MPRPSWVAWLPSLGRPVRACIDPEKLASVALGEAARLRRHEAACPWQLPG